MKIGRNDMCPCGSGKKYKRCCMENPVTGSVGATGPGQPPSLKGEVARIQKAAAAGEAKLREFGVFVLFSTDQGDAWLLEVSESDLVQVAAKGEKIDVEIDENPQTIAISWTHTFAIRNRQFVLTSYTEKTETVWDAFSTHAVAAAVSRIRRRISPDLADTLHLSEQEA